MSGSYLLYDSILENCGNFWKNGRFSGRIWRDWGKTARADMAGLGSILSAENLLPMLCYKAATLQHLTAAEYYSLPFSAKLIHVASYFMAVLFICCISIADCMLHMHLKAVE